MASLSVQPDSGQGISWAPSLPTGSRDTPQAELVTQLQCSDLGKVRPGAGSDSVAGWCRVLPQSGRSSGLWDLSSGTS